MRTTKENLLKKILLTLVIFLSSFINPSNISADVCDPWTCAGTTNFSVVANCVYNGTYCENGNVTNFPLNCDTTTCAGNAPGVDGCLGNTPAWDIINCVCSDADSGTCPDGSTNGSACSLGSAYTGVCQDCEVKIACGQPASSSRSCCDNSALPPPTEDPNPTAIPEPTSTPLSCDSACTTDTQCTDVNPDWTCYATSNTCRLATYPDEITCVIPICTFIAWDPCSEFCGDGIQFDNCENPQPCNILACPINCNDYCNLDSQCDNIDGSGTDTLWDCHDTGETNGRCRSIRDPDDLSCIPCYPSCGGTECGDFGDTPNQVTNVKINEALSGNLDLTSSASLDITWNDPGVPDSNSTINYYTIRVWDKAISIYPPGTCDSTTNCVRYQTASKIVGRQSYAAVANAIHGNDIYASVTAVNNTCTPVVWGAWSSNSSFDLVANVGGDFIDDPSATTGMGNNCTSSSTTPISLGTNTTVESSFGGSETVLGTDTSYSISVPYAPIGWEDHGFNVTLEIINSDPANSLMCSCPTDLSNPFKCEHTDTASPALSEHMYLTSIDLSNDSWWQTSGGNVYGASSLISPIPAACDSDSICKAYIITKNATDNKSAGVPLTGASSIDSNTYYTERGASEPKAIDTDHNNLIREDYAYFKRGVDLSNAIEITGPITTIPSGAPYIDNTEVYYSNNNLNINISSTENVASNRKIIILVDGDITFSSDPDSDMDLITVQQGGFIGFISSENIIFDASVGNDTVTDTNPNIAGVFVADGLIKVDGYSDATTPDDTLKDNKFIGEGTFVGWSGFSLTRDYANTTNVLDKALNNTNPVEVFVFRPDFNLNIPDIMMRPNLVWQEVN